MHTYRMSPRIYSGLLQSRPFINNTASGCGIKFALHQHSAFSTAFIMRLKKNKSALELAARMPTHILFISRYFYYVSCFFSSWNVLYVQYTHATMVYSDLTSKMTRVWIMHMRWCVSVATHFTGGGGDCVHRKVMHHRGMLMCAAWL